MILVMYGLLTSCVVLCRGVGKGGAKKKKKKGWGGGGREV